MPYADIEDRRQHQREYRLLNPEKIKVSKKNWRQSSRYKYGEIKKGAKKRELNFQITYQEYVSVYWQQTCFYCPETNTKGIDRIDSSKGYTLDNCVPCCFTCNQMKSDYDFNEFINHINRISAKSGTYKID